MSHPEGSDPLDPRTLLNICRNFTYHAFNESLPKLWTAISELPANTAKAYIERDRRFDARQGAIGDPYKGWIDPGLVDAIEERKASYEVEMERRKWERDSERKGCLHEKSEKD
ncbi:unnamed protein product [Zymoseptoria tritici ST99CH_3D1]|uniref:Uncharacterized protein n=1 Tax=Zymoseptoria tritici (strain ST99CH_3D7) TaxID=1276538 RepID=A0A1X7RCM3_ZYMT9|nr:unnamed protein product [Zymoseptoria tritici ST99CH_3D7]SMR43539.1 unnamed protein product [Zymoseptoria tritici ST99CH_3D1]